MPLPTPACVAALQDSSTLVLRFRACSPFLRGMTTSLCARRAESSSWWVPHKRYGIGNSPAFYTLGLLQVIAYFPQEGIHHLVNPNTDYGLFLFFGAILNKSKIPIASSCAWCCSVYIPVFIGGEKNPGPCFKFDECFHVCCDDPRPKITYRMRGSVMLICIFV